jgi:hypothetical protein
MIARSSRPSCIRFHLLPVIRPGAGRRSALHTSPTTQSNTLAQLNHALKLGPTGGVGYEPNMGGSAVFGSNLANLMILGVLDILSRDGLVLHSGSATSE